MDLALSIFRASVREVAILLFEPLCARSNVFEEVWEEVSHGRGAGLVGCGQFLRTGLRLDGRFVAFLTC